MTEVLTDTVRNGLTVRRLRMILDDLPGDTEVIVAVRDRAHVNALLGELQVLDASISNAPEHPAIVLDVAGLS